MKTAKEKAEELIDKFTLLTTGGYDLAVISALISIDKEIETIEILIKLCNSDNFMKIHLENKLQELQELKSEIEKL